MKKETVKDGEIDLVELAKLVWSKRRFVIRVFAIFFVLGLVIAFTSKVEFKATCKLLPENQEMSSLGGLGGLAGLAGFDLSSLEGNEVLSPELYPEIVNSVPFLKKTINTPVYFEIRDTTISSFDYLTKIDRPSFFGLLAEYTIGLPGKIKKGLSGSDDKELKEYDFIRFSEKDWEIIEKYKERLSVSVDAKTGTIMITSEMPDPVAAAEVANLVVEELTKTVIDYNIEKSKINLEFIEERFKEAEAEYGVKQNQLALFTDRNRNISNSIIQTTYENLQNELDITFEVYKSLATQLEQAKIKVKEDTPVFTILEPVRIPEKKDSPKRVLIIIVASILGTLTSFIFILINTIIPKKNV